MADSNAGPSARPQLTVVVPTRNEAGNVAPLLARLSAACTEGPTEVIFVDDSSDDTPAAIAEAAALSPLAVRVIHRPAGQRQGGLGGAVVEGLRAAAGTWVCVMDADLQHPPETLPLMLSQARRTGADLVLASRFARSGSAGGLSAGRFAVSKGTALAAQVFFPRRLRGVSDPLTGFFVVRRDTVEIDRLRPRGFKILLEILVRCPHIRVAEVPFRFQNRHAGESKAGLREVIRYLALLMGLRFGGVVRRATSFGIVGATGLVVNQLLMLLFTELAGLHYVLSSIAATQGSTVSNFALTDAWVFRDRSSDGHRLRRLGQYAVMNNIFLAARVPLLVLLVSGMGMHYLAANVVSILVMTIARFVLCERWIWPEAGSAVKRFTYDIHGIIRIASDVRLPELDFFRVGSTTAQADLTVSLGRTPFETTQAGTTDHANGHDTTFRYREMLGPLGFWVDISRGTATYVTAAPVLKFSPHVLYTNVVEPILRWMLVERGYALLHAACIARDGKAILVTARTDTGKTTTILRLLAREQVPFLSDDMMILCPDGKVLCYPKPLTISHHTLSAVDGNAKLSRLERLALPLQSRVHSKTGRVWALLLTRFPLPMASVNAYVQLLIPPPKYSIDRLVPGVSIVRQATIVHRVEIERGPNREVSLDPREAEETLLKNCEDAYGFPPYETLGPFLSHPNGEDLQAKERTLIRQSLGDRGTTLVSSQTRDWWRTLQVVVQAAASGQTLATPFGQATTTTIGAAPTTVTSGDGANGVTMAASDDTQVVVARPAETPAVDLNPPPGIRPTADGIAAG
jgi:dolichol-phosphate mannosyltransferase